MNDNDLEQIPQAVTAAMTCWGVTEDEFVQEGLRNEAAGIVRLTGEQSARMAAVLEMSRTTPS